MKNKFGEYRPVDRKANKYFTLDEEEEEFDRRKQKERGINQQYQQYQNKYGNSGGVGTIVHSRFQERNEPSPHSRGKVERDRSANRQTGGRSGVKDTR